MTEATKVKLAAALRAVGFEHLATRAAAGEFSDFDGLGAMPKIVLVGELTKIYKNHNLTSDVIQSAHRIACEVRDGKWDDSAEEAAAWMKKRKK